MSYTVTRSGNGHVFTLYRGRLRHRAEATYERAAAEPGTSVTFTEHTVPAKVIRQKSTPRATTWVELRCSKCGKHHNAILEACKVHGFPVCHDIEMSIA